MSRPSKKTQPKRAQQRGPAKKGPPKKPTKKRPTKSAAPPRKRSSAKAKPSNRPGERLQKVLAAAGVASRRESEELITEGRVQVDGDVVSELGARVEPHQEIRVDGELITQPRRVYYAVHKPTGVVCTASDPAGRPRVIDMIPPEAGRVFNVGRLDMASEGLILLTNDGELANQLTHPRHGVEKTYEVQVAGKCEPEVLAQLRKGMYLAEGFAKVVNVKIKSRRKMSTLLEMVLDEGRNREIRRLFARVGHKVQKLTRIAVGPVRLGDLPRGAHRILTPQELKKLRDAVDAPKDEKLGEAAKRGKAAARKLPSSGSAARGSAGPSKKGAKPSKGRPAKGKQTGKRGQR
ncbi:pseudouridine synthase [Adhaeretor mobilis]|uniref:Pseudouridine synthase n=1 Tax=Adhaeretor mobilis TaxID=1930276 RepID=A0A517MZ76_9BACT|nr:pseudouridine synthase [Adhaeretor mobilis]QDT00196.1 Ribosomal large subunit pseudouridine synthase B [Adhaeretor mobilis]